MSVDDDPRSPLPSGQQQRPAGDRRGHEQPQRGEGAEDERSRRAERVAGFVAVGRALAEDPAEARAEDGDRDDRTDHDAEHADQVRVRDERHGGDEARERARGGGGR